MTAHDALVRAPCGLGRCWVLAWAHPVRHAHLPGRAFCPCAVGASGVALVFTPSMNRSLEGNGYGGEVFFRNGFDTVAVKVMELPDVCGLLFDVTATVVDAVFTVCVTGEPVVSDEPKLPSPP